MKRLILLVLAIFVLAAAFPVFAQDEAVQTVSDAVAALQELDSYTTHVEQTIAQNIEMGSGDTAMSITNDIVQTIDLQVAKTDEGYNAVGTIDQNIASGTAGQSQELAMTIEIVLLDGVAFLRGSSESPMLANIIPTEWTEIDDSIATTNPTLAGFSPSALQQFYGINAAFDAETIESITELDSAEIDGQSMRVFEIEYSLDALLESGMLSGLTGGMGAQAGMSDEDLQALVEDILSGSDATYTAYIGADDGLLHQLDSVLTVDTTMNLQGMSLPLQMTVDSSSTFSGFNEPVEIEAPEVGT
jgi:hypothetical protein